MSIMSLELVPVEHVRIGDLLLVANPPSGPWFASVIDFEDGLGVRTFRTAQGFRTLAWHQNVEVGR